MDGTLTIDQDVADLETIRACHERDVAVMPGCFTPTEMLRAWQAGIDVVCDGELYRFDINHPETNGMIEYFVRPMSGVRRDIEFSEWLEYSRGAGMRFRTRPPGVVAGPIGPGTLNLSLPCARAKALASRPFKFTLTGPHMLAKTLHDRHYRSPEKLAHALAGVLAGQVKHLDADVVQIDEANLPGHPQEWKWAAAAMNKVLRAIPKRAQAAVHLCFGKRCIRSAIGMSRPDLRRAPLRRARMPAFGSTTRRLLPPVR